METVERHVTLPTEPTEAWDLLTDPEELARWLGDEVDLDPTPGAPGRILERDGSDRHLIVEEVIEGHRLAWRWWREGDDPDASASRVEITLSPAPDGTLVRVVERPLSAPSTWQARTSLGPAAAWAHRLLHLEALVLLAVVAAGR